MVGKTTRLVSARFEAPDHDVASEVAVQRMVEIERQWTTQFLEVLRTFNPDDRKMFRYVIAQFLSKFSAVENLSQHLSMNSTTIIRWATGEMTPPRPHRASVVAQLTFLLQRSADTAADTSASYFQGVLDTAAQLMDNSGKGTATTASPRGV